MDCLDVGDTINLFVDLAAAGKPREALRLLQESTASKPLEPLIIGLRLFLKEDVAVATEILEVGKDVAKRIEKRQGEFQMNRVETPDPWKKEKTPREGTRPAIA